MKQKHFVIWSFLTMLFALSSCTQESYTGEGDSGSFQLSLATRYEVIAGDPNLQQDAAEQTETDVNLFSVAISKGEETLYSWNTYREMQEAGAPELRPSTYTVKAWHGDINQEGFDAPCYAGSSELVIRKGETTPVAVTCYLSNAKLQVAYTENFKKYFETYSAQVASSLGNTVEYVQDETRFAYFKPGTLTVKAKVRKAGQASESVYEVKTIQAEAQHAYVLTLDVDAGSATMTVTFSEDRLHPDEEKVFDVSDAALNAPVPYFKTTGFTDGETLSMPEGNVGQEVSAYLNAVAHIASCRLSTTSAYLTGRGWPADIDLTQPGAAEETLKEFRLETRGLTGNKDQMAWINFTRLLAAIPASAGETHEFTLSATDLYGKTSEKPLKLQVTMTSDGELQLSASEEKAGFLSHVCKVKATFQSNYPGFKGDPENIRVYLDENKQTELKCIHSEALNDKEFVLTLEAPESVKFLEPFTLSGEYLGQTPQSAPIPVEYGVLVMHEGEVWARKTFVHLFNASTDEVSLQYLPSGDTWTDFTEVTQKAEYQPQVGTLLQAKGLKENQDYRIRAVWRNAAGKPSNECEIHTENAMQIPNSDFEQWYDEEVWYKTIFLSGGEHIYSFYPYASSGEKWWSTLNDMTTLERSGVASWYYCAYPGTMPTNASNLHTAAWHWNKYGKTSLTEGSHGGNTAMEIATVGYGSNNWSAVSQNTEYRSAGQLFIGSFDRSSQKQTLGHAFECRPEQVDFYYKFYSYNKETTQAYAIVYDASQQEIGKGVLKITEPVNEYQKGSIRIEYSNETVRAASIVIMFQSTDAAQPATQTLQGSKGAWNAGYGDSRHIGSILTVDDVELIYE